MTSERRRLGLACVWAGALATLALASFDHPWLSGDRAASTQAPRLPRLGMPGSGHATATTPESSMTRVRGGLSLLRSLWGEVSRRDKPLRAPRSSGTYPIGKEGRSLDARDAPGSLPFPEHPEDAKKAAEEGFQQVARGGPVLWSAFGKNAGGATSRADPSAASKNFPASGTGSSSSIDLRRYDPATAKPSADGVNRALSPKAVAAFRVAATSSGLEVAAAGPFIASSGGVTLSNVGAALEPLVAAAEPGETAAKPHGSVTPLSAVPKVGGIHDDGLVYGGSACDPSTDRCTGLGPGGRSYICTDIAGKGFVWWRASSSGEPPCSEYVNKCAVAAFADSCKRDSMRCYPGAVGEGSWLLQTEAPPVPDPCGSGTKVASCSASGKACSASGKACCSGLTCGSDGKCASAASAPETCAAVGKACGLAPGIGCCGGLTCSSSFSGTCLSKAPDCSLQATSTSVSVCFSACSPTSPLPASCVDDGSVYDVGTCGGSCKQDGTRKPGTTMNYKRYLCVCKKS